MAFMDGASMWKFGLWLRRRYQEVIRRARDAGELVAGSGVPEIELAKEWEEQVNAQLVKPPRALYC